MTNIFIVWTSYQARVEGITEDLGHYLGKFKIIYRTNPPATKLKKIYYYIKYFFADFICILRNAPKRVFVQIPPSYSLIAPILIKKIFRKKIMIIADCHNAMTRAPWLTRMGSKTLVNIVDLLILHNDVVYRNSNTFFPNIPKDKICVLEDKTVTLRVPLKKLNLNINHPFIFIPSSFNLDEPVKDIISAARMLPNYQFVMTGSANKLKKNFHISSKSKPDNLILTGWLTKDDYRQYLYQCDVLMGLTIYDDIQMSVSNEGLGAGKIMVLSNKRALRIIYRDGAIYAENEAQSICKAIHQALQNKAIYIKRIKIVQNLKEQRYKEQLSALTQKISSKEKS